MTKHKTDWQLGDMPDFDPIKMKRRIQAEIYDETKHMTPAQRMERTRRRLEHDERWRAAYAKADSAMSSK